MNEEISIKEGVDISVSVVLDKIKGALQGVERVVSSRSTLPILNNVLIRTSKNGVEVMATDLEIGLRFFLGGKVEREGVITVPGRTLVSLVNSLHGDTLSLESKGNILQVSCGETRASINGMPADDFPVIPEVEGGKVVKVKSEQFKNLLSQVDFAASGEDSRPVLTGVYLIYDGGTLTAVATDSYRLSEAMAKDKLGEDFNVIIPARTLQEVRRLVGEAAEFELRIGENQIMVITDSATLVSRIIEGEYPNYKQIIPPTSETTIEMDVQEFSDAIKTAAIFSMEGSNTVRLNVAASGLVEVVSESSQVGNFTSKLKAEVKGPGGEISFNAKYLLDGMNSFDTPRFTLGMTGKTAAGVFRPSGVEDRLYLVMPLRS
ncbi:TPA: DNA polymerase III subunit beta [Patescibacteria group bacterium]|uniref:Beta sliding clamp n=2 Tax=Bacteria division Kazan-3B-28 TaxID=1798534 RepID=A0A0G1X8U6_UNCK3|nr:MAG: polymerase III, beta subunit protein [candidate division Kazan bacterium GW2011_GWA1_50_15]KKW25770.1 MAG: polymerase III subunit beta protein [candidate division Kazan bacterium GW2011_GWC1_52_13]KKW27215.1 MAG: polymerase III subunit beta protein [candidate division Kazan bacterium GW2011_GWB1_52_7]HCL47737.1 DNA polymerase III subunit beta [Patescibacteria group bacterium]HCR42509.1 DNA polymerase III subunit beta [Patescibacteria group bacterium]